MKLRRRSSKFHVCLNFCHRKFATKYNFKKFQILYLKILYFGHGVSIFNPTCSGLFSAVRDVGGGQFGPPIDFQEGVCGWNRMWKLVFLINKYQNSDFFPKYDLSGTLSEEQNNLTGKSILVCFTACRGEIGSLPCVRSIKCKSILQIFQIFGNKN